MGLPQDPFVEWWITRLSVPGVKLTPEESAFVQSRTPNERLQLMELCRRRFYGLEAATARIQKVVEIIDLKDLA